MNTLVPAGGNNRRLLCQSTVRASIDAGDSGAPAFKVTDSPNPNDIELVGLVWGRDYVEVDEGEFELFFWFSPIGNIYADLGQAVTWDSCDPSRNC